MTVLLTPFLLMLAFCVGYAIRRGSICAVAATQSLIVERRSRRFRAFGVAAAGAGAVILPLHWLFPASATLSAGYPVTVQVLLAGVAFGLGARINRACALGTLAHLTGGNLVYGLTIVGMVGGAIAMASLGTGAGNDAPLRVSPLEQPGMGALAVWGALVVVLIVALYRRAPRWLRNMRDPASTRMGPYRAMLVVGVCGGLLYTLAGSWTYMSLLSHRAERLVHPDAHADGLPVVMCAATVVIGGLIAAWWYGDFDLRRPKAWGGARCLSGGAIMGASAAIIPGGNGTMLIHGLPSLAPHAIAAYAAMTVTLCLSFLIRRRT
ncbi:response regulator SirA [Roseobacter denitrificans]|uniref:Uncharacterized protein n=1 Tax=Roseobacter denitrificans (strain ATCC 33942 / OCh 114) TaxID=375451 RepID=Q162F1_ROSDO|nr:YeeE/YedE thiosulfate transporter family protein [Roseobacter denitrificans]ABG33142.1 conserved hypothetical protein [Roseobacter denitrificans OCh 114]AVL52504.1 response regulator SirA [Roseobacter denitrificans]SFG07218.1 hypothetical protein SAMN05443635_1073 [Roseobacter denitrificans OCh 114]